MSAHIPLRDRAGLVRGWAKVDEDDLGRIGDRRWHLDSTGYAATDRHMRLHRLLIDVPAGMVVDHINRNKLDNRRVNLRVVTQRVNCQNTSGMTLGAASRHRGVYFDRRRGTWYVQVKHGGIKTFGGTFQSETAAAATAVALRAQIFGAGVL